MSPAAPVTQFYSSSQALLRLLCWFSAKPVPFRVLQTRAANLIFETTAGRLARDCGFVPTSQPALQTVLASLLEASILKAVPDADSFLIDREVRIGTRTLIPPDQERFWLRCAMMIVRASFPSDPLAASGEPVMESLRPHLEALVTAGDLAGVHHPTVRLMTDLGSFLFDRAELDKAESLFRRAATLHHRKFGSEHVFVAASQRHVARVLNATNRESEAESLLRKSVVSLEESQGADSPWLCELLEALAFSLCRQMRLAEAEAASRRALAICERNYGSEHWSVACRLHSLASILRFTDPEQAASLLRRALDIDGRVLEQPHSLVAVHTYALANALSPDRPLADIEPLLRRAGEINRQIFGPDHPACAEGLYWDSVRLGQRQKFDEAEECIRRAIAIHEKCAPDNRDLVFGDLNQLALLFKLSGRHHEAEALFLRLRSESEQRPGFASLNLAACLNNLAQLYSAMHRHSEAELSLSRSLEVYLQFGVATGRHHRQLPFSVKSYRRLLIEMKSAPDDIESRLRALLQPYGISEHDLQIPSDLPKSYWSAGKL